MNAYINTVTNDIVATPPPSQSLLVRTAGHGDSPFMGYMPTEFGNYDFIKLCRVANGTYFNERHQPFSFTDDDIAFVKAIQPDDAHIYGATQQQKYNWLGFGRPMDEGRPYFNTNRRDFMIYGHSLARVGVSKNFVAEFPSGKKENQKFYEVKGFRRSMIPVYLGEFVDYTYEWYYNRETHYVKTRIRNEVIPLIESGVVQVCTETQTTADGVRISVTSKGVKLDIVPDPLEYDHLPGDTWLWDGAIRGI